MLYIYAVLFQDANIQNFSYGTSLVAHIDEYNLKNRDDN